MREYNGEPKREPIILDDDAAFVDESDLDAANLVRADAEYQKKHDAVNRAANSVCGAVSDIVLLQNDPAAIKRHPELHQAWVDWLKAVASVRGVVSDSTEEG